MLPYVSQLPARRKNPCPNRINTCQKAFTFQNVLPLTSDGKEFEREVSKQNISGNLDSPEAGLDAIMQAAVCKVRARMTWKKMHFSNVSKSQKNIYKRLILPFLWQDKIKWGNVTRILVYTSDDTFHMAGDGRLGGAFLPHNGQCHFNDTGSYIGKIYVSNVHLMIFHAFPVVDWRKRKTIAPSQDPRPMKMPMITAERT